MARPTKDGLDYFPMDCMFDDKIELLEAKYGAEGCWILVKLWQQIYKDRGYFYPWAENEQILFSRRTNKDIAYINEIIAFATSIKLFDSEKLKLGVLTSSGIQKRYFQASKRRKGLVLYRDILLIDVDNNSAETGVNAPETQQKPSIYSFQLYRNPAITPERKEKKRKEKEIKECGVNAAITPQELPQESPRDPRFVEALGTIAKLAEEKRFA